MVKMKVLFALLVIAALLFAGCAGAQNSPAQPAGQPSSSGNAPISPPANSAQGQQAGSGPVPAMPANPAKAQPPAEGQGTQVGITMEQLAAHSTESDCWVVYKNKVYDITPLLPKHPGGASVILPYCGTTGFEGAFEAKHGTSKVDKLMKMAREVGGLAG
jgi:hypothetical protein